MKRQCRLCRIGDHELDTKLTFECGCVSIFTMRYTPGMLSRAEEIAESLKKCSFHCERHDKVSKVISAEKWE